MEFEYNLQEAVSEECYNDILDMVEANLVEMGINEVHLADYLETATQKHGPGIIKAAGANVLGAAKGIKHATGEFLSTSNSGVANALRKVPGVRDFARSHAASQLRHGRAKLNKERQQSRAKAVANYTQDKILADTSTNPAQANAQINARLHANVNAAAQRRANKMQALKNKYSAVNN